MIREDEHEPFFSIVVPTFNRETYIVKAIQSVLDQEFVDFEVIVVDDGSTDNTKAVIQNRFGQYPNVRYFCKENEERSIARNFGVAQAKGKYIGFLDSDDLFYKDHLSTGYDLLTAHDLPEVGILGYELTAKDGQGIRVLNNFNDQLKDILIRENIINGNSILVRRDIALQIQFIPSRFAILSEDWYVWLRLAARYRFVHSTRVTSAVIDHEERSLKNIDPVKLIVNTELIIQYLREDKVFMDVYKKQAAYHFANHYTFLTLILSSSKSYRSKTIKYLAKAIRCDPRVIFRRRFLASVKHWF